MPGSIKIFNDIPTLRAHMSDPVVATIGNYDGLHRGHRTIIERVLARARSIGGRSLLITFDRGSAASYNVDNIVVEPIPEPRTALLLMTGLLGLANYCRGRVRG